MSAHLLNARDWHRGDKDFNRGDREFDRGFNNRGGNDGEFPFGSNNRNQQEIILLLFTLFGILVTLFLMLIVFLFQTWTLWKIARVVVEQNGSDEDDGGKRTEGTATASASGSATGRRGVFARLKGRFG